MRHSSWTLFLVPLALPLVLLIPGVVKTAGPVNPAAGARYDQVQARSVYVLESPPSLPGYPEGSPQEKPEALYKD